jgi:hypothetical protein
MIMDERAEFCDATALNTGAPGGYLVGDIMDISPTGAGAVGRDIGRQHPLYLVITVDTTATSGGAATGQFSLVSDAITAIDPATGTYHFSTKAFALAELTAGSVLACVALPWEGVAYERYLGIVQTTGTAAFTGGKINAFLTHDPARWQSLPDAVN